MLDPEETLDLVPLSAVALPGQEVQLRFRAGSAVAQLLQTVFDRGYGNRRFGLALRKEGGRGYAQIGTVAELLSIMEDEFAAEEEHMSFCLRAKAVSAFRIVKMVSGSCGVVVTLPLGEGEWNITSYRHDQRSVRPFSAWVYRDRDTPSLTRQLQSLYAAHFNKPLTRLEGEQDLSFQVASELFRRREERISILSEQSTSVRLFRCIEKLSNRRDHVISCSNCSRPLALRMNMVDVAGAKGACGVYTNPHGIVHSTVTCKELISAALHSVIIAGLPTMKDTWFSGYYWQILYCRCRAHLGWRYSKASGEEFWGFRHESIAEGGEGNVDLVEVMEGEDEDDFEDALNQGDEDEEEDEEFEDNE